VHTLLTPPPNSQAIFAIHSIITLSERRVALFDSRGDELDSMVWV